MRYPSLLKRIGSINLVDKRETQRSWLGTGLTLFLHLLFFLVTHSMRLWWFHLHTYIIKEVKRENWLRRRLLKPHAFHFSLSWCIHYGKIKKRRTVTHFSRCLTHPILNGKYAILWTPLFPWPLNWSYMERVSTWFPGSWECCRVLSINAIISSYRPGDDWWAYVSISRCIDIKVIANWVDV